MNLDLYRRIVAGETATALLSPRALWKLSGPDAERYLNGQVTCDVTKITRGHASYAAVCTAKGRMEGDAFIARHGAEFHLDSSAELRESLGSRLDKYLIADDAAFEDVSDAWILLHKFGATSPSAMDGSFAVVNPRFGIAGHDVWYPVQPGRGAVDAWVDKEMLEIFQIEHGIPRWGAELTANTLPPEAGPHMLDAISYTKGCYVGQETIARLKSVGHVNKVLVSLRSASRDFPAPGTKLEHGKNEVGVVTSSCLSPRLEKGIALGYCQYKIAAEGASLQAGGLPLTISPALNNQRLSEK